MLCKLAQRHPIPHQCFELTNSLERRNEWCLDCWTQEHDGQNPRNGEQVKNMWDDRWRGGSRWTGYNGEHGRDVWRDDVPQ